MDKLNQLRFAVDQLIGQGNLAMVDSVGKILLSNERIHARVCVCTLSESEIINESNNVLPNFIFSV